MRCYVSRKRLCPILLFADGCFICGICVFVCATGYMITAVFMYGIKLYLILKTTNEYIIQNLKITLSSKLPVMFMLRQSTK